MQNEARIYPAILCKTAPPLPGRNTPNSPRQECLYQLVHNDVKTGFCQIAESIDDGGRHFHLRKTEQQSARLGSGHAPGLAIKYMFICKNLDKNNQKPSNQPRRDLSVQICGLSG